jgi:hypothetical protein
MSNLIDRLEPDQQRGSKPRCHAITHGSPEEVSTRLTSLIEPWGAVAPSDRWMPDGFDNVEEARLDKALRLIPAKIDRAALRSWWLTVPRGANTPNWDIASTCKVSGCPGLLLVEAKAHDNELRAAEAGKLLRSPVTINSRRNHARIGWCIEDASLALTDETRLNWTMSRDSRYQMVNRFAWSWKLTELKYAVILVYLGFVNAEEMRDKGTPLTAESWPEMVRTHCAPLFPGEVWDREWKVNGQSLVPLIRTIEQPLCCEAEAP